MLTICHVFINSLSGYPCFDEIPGQSQGNRFKNAVHFSNANKSESPNVEMTTSQYFQGGDGIPPMDHPEHFRPII